MAILAGESVGVCLPPFSADILFFFSSRRRHTRFDYDWSSDVCSSDLGTIHVQACPLDYVPVPRLRLRQGVQSEKYAGQRRHPIQNQGKRIEFHLRLMTTKEDRKSVV